MVFMSIVLVVNPRGSGVYQLYHGPQRFLQLTFSPPRRAYLYLPKPVKVPGQRWLHAEAFRSCRFGDPDTCCFRVLLLPRRPCSLDTHYVPSHFCRYKHYSRTRTLVGGLDASKMRQSIECFSERLRSIRRQPSFRTPDLRLVTVTTSPKRAPQPLGISWIESETLPSPWCGDQLSRRAAQ